MLVRWMKRYETGIIKVDHQHRKIFDQTHQLLEVAKSDKLREEKYKKASEMLDFLVRYVNTHFKDEERIQLQYDYPNYEEHKSIHDNFIKEIRIFKRKFEVSKGESIVPLTELNKIVLKWLVKHIAQEDKKVADYIKECQE